MEFRRWRMRAVAAALVLSTIAAACGDDDSGGSPAATTGGAAPSTSLTPKVGGTVSMGMFSETQGLDPVVTNGGGTTGSTEVAAFFDTIMRFDTDTKKYVPQTAESLTPNAEFSEWTLKLRPGIKFSDGTDYDAAAVEAGLKRHVTQRSRAALMVSFISKYEVVDKVTLKMTLSSPWAGFPYVLAYTPGMIPSPAAIAKCDQTKPARECEFNLKPVGAGPFIIDGQYKKGEPIVGKRNPNYWGGQVYLDSVRFALLAGAPATYDALKNNTLNVAFLREPAVVKRALDEKQIGGSYVNLQWLGGVALLNNGQVRCNANGGPVATCQGQAAGTVVNLAPAPNTADKRVRQAVAFALDPAVINQRANDGAGYAGTEWFQKGSKWGPVPAQTTFNLNRAKELVAQVKAEGKWDGTIKVNCHNAPSRLGWATAMQAMLEAAGFKVQLKNDYDTNALVADVLTTKNFDVACWGLNMSEEEPYISLIQAVDSRSTSNSMNYVNDKVDAQIKIVREAKTDAERKAALDEIQKIWVDEVPTAVYEAIPEMIAWRKEVQGLKMNASTIVLFDKAWINN